MKTILLLLSLILVTACGANNTVTEETITLDSPVPSQEVCSEEVQTSFIEAIEFTAAQGEDPNDETTYHTIIREIETEFNCELPNK